MKTWASSQQFQWQSPVLPSFSPRCFTQFLEWSLSWSKLGRGNGITRFMPQPVYRHSIGWTLQREMILGEGSEPVLQACIALSTWSPSKIKQCRLGLGRSCPLSSHLLLSGITKLNCDFLKSRWLVLNRIGKKIGPQSKVHVKAEPPQ